MRTQRYIPAALLLLALTAPGAVAQDDQGGSGQEPIPAYHSPLASAADNGQDSETGDQMTPDTNPLSGVQDLSLGNSAMEQRTYWQPHVSVTASANSNAAYSTSGGWSAYSTFTGGIDLHRVSEKSNLLFEYLGGGSVASGGTGNSFLQQFTFGDTISFSRTILSFSDSASYLPESAFGYNQVGGVPLSVGGPLGYQPPFVPSQSVLTNFGQRISNASTGQVNVLLSGRSSLTFSAGYSLLDFFGDNLLNSGDMTFRAGYNYQFSPANTFAVFYQFSGFRYSNVNQSINDHSMQVSYGRRITGKLALQAGGGIDLGMFETPLTPSSTGGTGSTGGTTNSLYWSMHAALTYRLERTALGMTYTHGLSSGSGVLAGADSDMVTGNVSRPLSRVWSGGINLGYSRNRGVGVATAITPTIVTPISDTYDYVFAGANVSRPLGRLMSMSLGYQMQYQTSNNTFCAVGTTACSSSYIWHQVLMTFRWTDRPLAF